MSPPNFSVTHPNGWGRGNAILQIINYTFINIKIQHLFVLLQILMITIEQYHDPTHQVNMAVPEYLPNKIEN